MQPLSFSVLYTEILIDADLVQFLVHFCMLYYSFVTVKILIYSMMSFYFELKRIFQEVLATLLQ